MEAARSSHAASSNTGGFSVTRTRDWMGTVAVRRLSAQASCMWISFSSSFSLRGCRVQRRFYPAVSQGVRGPYGPRVLLPLHLPLISSPAVIYTTPVCRTRGSCQVLEVSLKQYPTCPQGPLATPAPTRALVVPWPGMLFMSLSSDCFPDSSDGQIIRLASGEKAG